MRTPVRTIDDLDTVLARRDFLPAVCGTIIAFPIAGLAQGVRKGPARQEKEEEEISPTEDLMQEHGVLNRLLGIYQEAIARIGANRQAPFEEVRQAADLIRRFVEDYHEKHEEDFVFPRFRKANQQADLVKTLYAQHQAGRKLTEQILSAAQARPSDGAGKAALRRALEDFIRMYRPHAERETTVLFPAFRDLLPKGELKRLGGEFEKSEQQLFGPRGFENVVEQVAGIEKRLGIYELQQFTPKTSAAKAG